MAFKGIKIVNKTGIANDTRVYNSETDEELHGINKIELLPFAVGETVKARLTFNVRMFEVSAEVVGGA